LALKAGGMLFDRIIGHAVVDPQPFCSGRPSNTVFSALPLPQKTSTVAAINAD
jgi:hypothetical protein